MHFVESGVADREHLVDKHHVRVGMDHDRECQPHLHPGRVVLEFLIDEPLELSKRDDLVESLLRLAWSEPIITALITTLSLAGTWGLNPTPSSKKGDKRPAIWIRPASAR
jgi:hypothetical protein